LSIVDLLATIKAATDSEDFFNKKLDYYRNEEYNPERYWSDNNLKNPYSKATCVILYLYSMELGSPPLFHATNLLIS